MSSLKEHLDELAETLCEQVVDELLEIFRTQFQESCEIFSDCIVSKDYDRARELAHKMKSSAFNLGAGELGAIYQNLEKQPQLYLRQNVIGTVEGLYQKFRTDAEQWRRELG